MKRHLPLFACTAIVVALFASPLPAQQPFGESIEVRIANIDVVVTDKAGKPVHGLTKNDFVLLENGHEQPLTNFYEVRPTELTATAAGAPASAEPAPEPPPKEITAKRFLVFFDDYSMHGNKRKQIIGSLDGFVDKHMEPGDTMSIVRWMRGLHVIIPYTGEKKELHAAIDQLRRTPTTSSAEQEENRIKSFCTTAATSFSPRQGPGQGRAQCFDMVYGYSEEATALLHDLLADLRHVTSALAGIEGRKIILLAGSQLPERPGLELYHFANNLFFGAASAGQNIMQTHSEAIRIEDMARAANANGVTFYTLDTQEQHSVASAESSIAFDQMEDFTRLMNSAASYQTLARITGGVAITQAPSFDSAFDTIASDLSSYYSLGYRPQDTTNTKDRKIAVRTKNPEYRTRFRRSFAVKTADEQVGDRVIANIFHQGMGGDWPVEVKFGAPVKDGRHFNVPIEVRFAPKLTLLEQEPGFLSGAFAVYIAVGDESGRLSDVIKRPQTVRIPAAAEAEVRSKPFVFNATVQMRPGTNTLSVAVVDAAGGETGFGKAIIQAR